MSRQAHSYSTATTSRHITAHGTSSAFSSSANPDEDWTKISDLAERRRIQNRIAQRNYRKKLKRRLEELERRAGSSSASPPQMHVEIQQEQQQQQQRPVDHIQQFKSSPEIRQHHISPRLVPSQYTPPMQNDDDLMFSQTFEREGSRTPPLFTYSQYPAPGEIDYPPYPHSQPYRPISSNGERDTYADYMAPVPITLPPMMQFHDSIKRDGFDTMSPFTTTYHHGAHHYSYDDPHTPPLSHSYEHSTACSESEYQYPTTPLSMPPSPPLMVSQ